MKKEKKDKNFIKKPVYPGGSKALKEFVNSHLKYPKEAAENQIEGTVSMRYTIDHMGNVIDAHIISGLGFGCDEEAIRVVKKLKFHVDKVRGMRVTFKKNIHVHFRKPKHQKTTQKMTYQYTTPSTSTSKSSSPQSPAHTPAKKSYSYQIRIK